MNNKTDIEQEIKQYKELKKNKFIIASIEPDYFFSFVENILADRERLEKENEQSVSYQTLCDYLINSADETKKPIWTEAHIEELLNNFIIKWKEEK